jgi:hypothetical protein
MTVIVQDFNPIKREIEAQVKVVDAYMSAKQYPKDVRYRVREHYHSIEMLRSLECKENVLMSKLTADLAEDSRVHVMSLVFCRNHIFQEVDAAFIRRRSHSRHDWAVSGRAVSCRAVSCRVARSVASQRSLPRLGFACLARAAAWFTSHHRSAVLLCGICVRWYRVLSAPDGLTQSRHGA